ncbi:MAG: short-chain fatty acid transporter [Elusimicrobia bacterium]|nr:short-chain fatty acid transporter [Elusimicrobiota bacterium]
MSIHRLNQWMARVMPDAFALAVILTVIIFIAAWGLTPAGPTEILLAWGNGFWSFLAFAMQMCLVLLTGHIISSSPLVRGWLRAFSGMASSGAGACALMAATSMALAWVHWGLGLVGSSVMVRYIALRTQKVHYPLLVACGYFGLGALWHAGLSGSAPLLAATPGHFLKDSLGLVPLSETIFSSWNLAMSGVTLAALTALAWKLHPGPGNAVQPCLEKALDRFHEELVDSDETAPLSPPETMSEKIDRGYLVNAAIGACGIAYLILLKIKGPWSFDLNVFNFLFFMAAILLHPNIKSVVDSAQEGAASLSGIVMQFPLYAGMYGVIKSTGLAELVGAAFVSVATKETFPLVVYYYSGVLNYFVPSGGSKWAIEAPYLIEAARSLHISGGKLVLSYAWGDMVTDLIQPFWCLPLLAAAGIEFRQIMGYLAAAFLAAAAIGSAGIFILGYL